MAGPEKMADPGEKRDWYYLMMQKSVVFILASVLALLPLDMAGQSQPYRVVATNPDTMCKANQPGVPHPVGLHRRSLEEQRVGCLVWGAWQLQP